MDEKITINDIAQACGVSIATVSLVLNNRPGVAQETRNKVMEYAEGVGYVSRSSGAAARGRLSRLGLIIKTEPDDLPQANPFYSNVMLGIEQACRRMGISLLFSTLPVDENNHPLELPYILNNDALDGLLMVGALVDSTITAACSKRSLPIVLVDAYSDTETFDMVISDNFRAAYQAVEYLIQKGHRHIALAGSEGNAYPSLRDRRNGYLRALKENDIPDSYIAEFNINKNKGKGHAEIARLLKENPQISAIFGINDDIAHSALQAVKEMGLSVPQDISIVGYDDTLWAQNASPALTTMRVDTVSMGQAAVQLLSFRLDNPDAARMTLTIHPSLVERASVSSR
jgi:LacI family transcriptional regulator